jgi:hypothetical protein
MTSVKLLKTKHSKNKIINYFLFSENKLVVHNLSIPTGRVKNLKKHNKFHIPKL